MKKEAEQTKFGAFVRDFGVDELAERLAIRPSAIYHWLNGTTSPHPSNAIRIQALAKRRGVSLTLDEIYQHFRDVHSERYTADQLKTSPATA